MKDKIFTLAEARAMVPWLREASEEANNQVNQVRMEATNQVEAHARIRGIIHYWAETMAKLGCLPKQPFTVDFNSGSDYYCWEYPEEDIFYRHGYHSGYAGRRRIEDES